MIVRVSGTDSHLIARQLADDLPGASSAIQTRLRFDGMIVPAWVYLFAGPRSYTAEDLVEFHLPGNSLLARMLVDSVIKLGARHAEPGEFTARAFFSGRIDLTAAEGVAATIEAHCEQDLRAARQLMSGELARRLVPEMDALAGLLALVEAGIDFADEYVSFIGGAELLDRLGAIDGALQSLETESARFEPLTYEPRIVLVGRPNAGKSTLLNALAGAQRAVVSPIAGTTRDVLSVEVKLTRGLVRMLDVAGIDAGEESVRDVITIQMRQRALRTLEQVDYVVMVHDPLDAQPLIALPRQADLVVRTKSDLFTPRQSASAAAGQRPLTPGDAGSHQTESLSISALTGENLDRLRDLLDELAFGRRAGGGTLALNTRHRNEISGARAAISRAMDLAPNAQLELIALELRDALDSLGRVLGQITPDDVLGRIFSSFCIGK
jgi:tRNA modification GTPase